MRVIRLACLGAMLCASTLGLSAQSSLAPVVSQVSETSFTLSWSTGQSLNTQVHYTAPGSNTQSMANWTLVTAHSITVSGLTAGTPYSVVAESSYYSNPDILSAPFTVTTLAASASSTSSTSGMSTPVIGNVTSSGFTVTWNTSQALNSQLHYGIGGTGQSLDNWALLTNHSVAVSGLTPGTQYEVQAESSDYSNPDLFGPVQTVTTSGSGASSGSGSTTTSSASGSGSRLFTGSGANWLYSAPTGSGLNISSIASGMTFQINTHNQGFDYPVEDTDGTHGCTTFTDTAVYSYQTDRICVPNPPNGYYPSVGGWGADDGHLVVVDTATGEYYDFWKLSATNGVPDSTNVGGIVQGSLSGNGNPGTTAANITGLAGDIMPGELSCATCLNHALSVGVPSQMNSNQVGTQAPATKTDGTVAGAVFREGAKIRVDPSINVANLGVSVAVQAIMRALQLYGGVITDQGGNGSTVMFYTDLPSAPDMTGINQIGKYLQIYY